MERQASATRALPGRSCGACRRRKIRCDRQQPCSYCSKLKQQCIYQGTFQTSAVQSSQSNDVISRLDRIEQAILRLELRSNGTNSGIQQNLHQSNGGEATGIANAMEESHLNPSEFGPPSQELSSGSEILDTMDTVWTQTHKQKKLETGSEQADTVSVFTPQSTTPRREVLHEAAFLGSPSDTPSLTHLHPDQKGIFTLWQMFLENVDPIIKIFHVSSTQAQLMKASHDIAHISPTFECIMFAIYFSAVTSCQCSEASKELLDEEIDVLLARYRWAFEQALATAQFMSAPSFPILQALTVFLTCARQTVDTSYIWSMTGLLIRLAIKLGLHRDPDSSRFDPFTSEMRRRLWWQIFTLDVRVAEQNDMEPSIYEHQYNTKYPANVNDSDLDPYMTKAINGRDDYSDMVYTLCRFKISYAARFLVFSNRFLVYNNYERRSVDEKNSYVDSFLQDLIQKHFVYCDEKIPFHYLILTSCKAVITKLKLTINHPSQRQTDSMTDTLRVQLVKSSIEILQHAEYWRSNKHYSKWSWLFQNYVEWDATAFLLYTLTTATLSSLLEEAWKVIHTFFEYWEHYIVPENKRWDRLQSLRAKALAIQGPPVSVLPGKADGGIEEDQTLITANELQTIHTQVADNMLIADESLDP